MNDAGRDHGGHRRVCTPERVTVVFKGSETTGFKEPEMERPREGVIDGGNCTYKAPKVGKSSDR